MSLSRTAPRALRRTRQIPHFSRRSYSKSQETPTSGPTNTSHTHSTGAHVDPASTSESFGRSFYFAVGLVPVSMFIYSLSRDSKNGEKNPVTRALERYSDWREEWTRRNAIHTGLVEQAGHDRNLFINTPQPNWHDHRMPEMIGRGSPIAVPAGHSVDLGHVMEYYRLRNEREEQEKLARLQERARREEGS